MAKANDDGAVTEHGQPADDVVVPLRPDAARSTDRTNAERQARWRDSRRNGSGKKRGKNKNKQDARASTVTPPIAPTVTREGVPGHNGRNHLPVPSIPRRDSICT
jgi:hypothetical protein